MNICGDEVMQYLDKGDYKFFNRADTGVDVCNQCQE